MASAESVQAVVIGRMTAMFSPPHGCTDTAAALGEYLEYLKPYEAGVLDAAWKAVAKRHAKTTWPLPSVILQACDDELARRRTVTGQQSKPPYGQQGDDWKRFPGNAERAMESGLGQKALAEGWGRILYDRVYRTGDYVGFDTAAAKQLDADTRALVANLTPDDPCFTLGRNLVAREDELRRKYLRLAA